MPHSQEVAGSEDSALRAVVAADVELMKLREEEAEITARQDSVDDSHTNGNGTTSTSGVDQEELDSTRLNEIYERMQVKMLTSDSSILHGHTQLIFKFIGQPVIEKLKGKTPN